EAVGYFFESGRGITFRKIGLQPFQVAAEAHDYKVIFIFRPHEALVRLSCNINRNDGGRLACAAFGDFGRARPFIGVSVDWVFHGSILPTAWDVVRGALQLQSHAGAKRASCLRVFNAWSVERLDQGR